MKIIALLCMSAALGLAANQDPNQRPADQKNVDQKHVDQKHAATKSDGAAHPAAATPTARRNLHQPAKTSAAPKLTPQQQAAAALPTVPAGAEEAGPNLFRYTDAQGKHWMYRKTPFGVSKWEEKPGEQPSAGEPHSAAGLTATDMGDSVQFQRQTPFGPQKWTRKKSEMNEDEKLAFANQEHAKEAAAGKTADASKQPEKQ